MKKDAATGAVLPGAKFQISPNPTAGSTDQTAKTVTDNDGTVTAGELADADARPGYITVANVAPGVDYTVTELQHPRATSSRRPAVTPPTTPTGAPPRPSASAAT